MNTQNTNTIELTRAESNLISELIDFGPETIDGIKMSGIEVALYDLAIGAASFKMWDRVILAKSALGKLNAKAESNFFGYETSEQAPGVRYKAGTSYKCTPPATSNKVGRNEPCPCGSGNKSKKCCK